MTAVDPLHLSYVVVGAGVPQEAVDAMVGACERGARKGGRSRVAVLTAGYEIEVIATLCSPDALAPFPAPSAELTELGPLLDYLGDLLPHDIRWFAERGTSVLRPVVHLVVADADAAPAWWDVRAHLLDAPSAPAVLAYAVVEDAFAACYQVSTIAAYRPVSRDDRAVADRIGRGVAESILAADGAAAHGSLVTAPSDDLLLRVDRAAD
ncbi:MAG: hypothetical protein DHS20C19_23940 [Acidimicrobiales bacterium]|nr:MAG: hypothetical protein DHS20C19_23940 [Acidimicrobiales bacterium]